MLPYLDWLSDEGDFGIHRSAWLRIYYSSTVQFNSDLFTIDLLVIPAAKSLRGFCSTHASLWPSTSSHYMFGL
ncbi:unnamed protein product [Tuber melanosporum]|uniref:(Perigord truffle) hypothetical protein n=1 Tax=Tuber melanosporum (strain Mel28) TaxID=656061 RepID=D5GCM6_TUBMM|nr:uncharacterized protein GSTUM_00000731001 [Tuber melanosporum]CAZ82269.1 unnamed protein product [Tuber melanosporum]